MISFHSIIHSLLTLLSYIHYFLIPIAFINVNEQLSSKWWVKISHSRSKIEAIYTVKLLF